MKTDVFISHSSADRPFADALCAHLEGRRIRCWIAPRDVPAGAIWAEAIIDAIEQTRVMVFLLSSHANASRQVINEVERAVSKGVVILPVRVEDVQPSKGLEYFLASRHWLDALTPPLERHVSSVGDQIERFLQGSTAGSSIIASNTADKRSRWRPAVLWAVTALGAIAGVWLWFSRGEPERPPAGKETPPVANVSSERATTQQASTIVAEEKPKLETPVPREQSLAEPRDALPAASVVAPPPVAREVENVRPPTDERPTARSADVLLPDTVWAGEFADASGPNEECIAVIDRRTNERIHLTAYFPQSTGARERRWLGSVRAASVDLEGQDDDGQRITVTGEVSSQRLAGTWRNNGGRAGTFSLTPVTAVTNEVTPGASWRGMLALGNPGPVEIAMRVISRQREHISGRCRISGQRTEFSFSATLLGDRLFGAMNNLPLSGSTRISVRFSATVSVEGLAGVWNSDAGLSGALRWPREP